MSTNRRVWFLGVSMAKTRTTTVKRTVSLPQSDEELLDEIIEKLASHYRIAIVAKVSKSGFFRKKYSYSISMTGATSRVKMADENLIELVKEHNCSLDAERVVRWSDLPLWAGEPALF